ncbi:MAG: heavy metal translocating P-type ATPase [Cypionkella sp.]|nr:heavy metal translocating P-type ATPase [Cypionkella sp.]
MAQTISLSVDGMTCASCVGRAERVLRAQEGVIAASVNLALQSAQVVYDLPARPEAMAQALTRAGYAAKPTAREIGARLGEDPAQIWGKAALAGALTLPVFIAEMGTHLWPAMHHARAALIGDGALALLEMLLIGATLLGPGRVFFAKGIPALLRRAPDMNALVALGAGAAYVYSSAVTVLATGGEIYFESAGVTVTLILVGRALEARAKGAAGAAIARLVDLQPQTALKLQGDKQIEVPLAGLEVGDVILARAGERIAADGQVIAGASSVDMSMLTGEPMPQVVGVGDSVTGGCVNGAGALTVQITAAGAGSVLARITQMVADAQAGKLPVQDRVDRITSWFVPAVMALAALTFALWLGFGAGLGAALIHAVAVLIIACPCAMGLAVPVSILVGTGQGAQMGVLFRGAAALQRLSEVNTIAFDKTGTLSIGRPRVVGALDIASSPCALALAAGIESQSTHPLARAVLDYAATQNIAAARVENVQTLAGQGATGEATGEVAGEVRVGSARMMPPLPQQFADFDAAAQAAGQGVIFVAHKAAVVGAFAVEDSIKPQAAGAVQRLVAMGLRPVMLTGDSMAAARRVGTALGINDIRAQMLPEEKAKTIEELGRGVAFVGDGINDAPALARADVGISMGTGTDVAIEAGDVVLIGGDLVGVARAVTLSRAVMRNISQNLGWAFGYNAVLIPVAMGVLVPFGGPALSPMLGALAMAASSVFVVGNALRLRHFDPDHGV